MHMLKSERKYKQRYNKILFHIWVTSIAICLLVLFTLIFGNTVLFCEAVWKRFSLFKGCQEITMRGWKKQPRNH